MYRCAYTGTVDYEWDSKKAATNLRKHGIDFADVIPVFEDRAAITVDDRDQTEPRFATIGMDALLRVVVVVYTWRDETIRIISARRATPTERRTYEEGL
jgi:uncharacterized protein